jgi:hypothetical protein
VLDVAMTVDAIPSQDIIDIGALSIGDLQDFVPGLGVGSNPTQAGITNHDSRRVERQYLDRRRSFRGDILR